MSTRKPTHQAVVFQSPRGKKEWYWHVKAIRGGKIICASGEGFASRASAKKAMQSALKVAGGNTVETVVEPSLAQKKAAAEKAKREKAKAKKTARKTKAKKSTKTKARKPTPAKKSTKAPTAKKAKKSTKGKEIPRSKVKAKKTTKKTPAKRAKKLSVVDGGKKAA